MATIVDGRNAIVRRLQTMPGRPAIAYPGGPQVTEFPRIVVSFPASQQSTMDMSGLTDSFPEVSARIETEDGSFGAQAATILAAIQDRFRAATRFDGVEMLSTPQPASEYEAGGVYHIPVIIRGRYFF